MRPLDVEVIMHAWCIADKHPRMDARAVKDAFEYWVAFGVLKPGPAGIYMVTDLGAAYVKLILSTPVPKILYIDPRTNKPVPT